MAYQKILVPLDGSRLAERALPYARAVAAGKGAEVTLLTAATSEMRLDRPLSVYLELKAKELQSQGIKATSVVTYDGAADQIVDFADRNNIDLIVMSTHGHSGVKRWVLGSVAQKVLQGTCVPVLLVKSKAAEVAQVEFKKILLPLDGSPFSEIAISHVEELAAAAKAEVILMQVTEPPVISVAHEAAFVQTAAEIRDKLMRGEGQQAKEYLDKVKANLEAKKIKVKTLTPTGKAAQMIVGAVQGERVDLIVMGTHGRSGASRWAHGSVATKVVEDSAVPILLIRPCPPGAA